MECRTCGKALNGKNRVVCAVCGCDICTGCQFVSLTPAYRILCYGCYQQVNDDPSTMLMTDANGVLVEVDEVIDLDVPRPGFYVYEHFVIAEFTEYAKDKSREQLAQHLGERALDAFVAVLAPHAVQSVAQMSPEDRAGIMALLYAECERRRLWPGNEPMIDAGLIPQLDMLAGGGLIPQIDIPQLVDARANPVPFPAQVVVNADNLACAKKTIEFVRNWLEKIQAKYVTAEDVDDGEQLADDILEVGTHIDLLSTAAGLLEVNDAG